MRRTKSNPYFFCFILSCFIALTGCSLSPRPPDAAELLSVLASPFSCTFTVSTAEDSTPQTVLFTRSETEDRFTLGTAHLCFGGGSWYFSVDDPASAPFVIPVTPTKEGAVRWRTLFSVTDDGTWSTERCADGIAVTNARNTYRLVFSEDGIPKTLSDGVCVLSVTAFTQSSESTYAQVRESSQEHGTVIKATKSQAGGLHQPGASGS